MSKTPTNQITAAKPEGRISEPARHALRQMVMQHFYATPLGGGKARALNESPDWDTIRPLIEPALRDRVEHEIALQVGELISGEGSEMSLRAHRSAALHFAIQQQWPALWQNLEGPRPDFPTDSEVTEPIEILVNHLCFPPFAIPPHTSLALYDRALKAAINAPYDDTTFKASPLMQDEALIEIMESALRELSDDKIRTVQRIRHSLAPPEILEGERARPTFAQERDYFHRIRDAIRSVRKLPADAPPPDAYDLFAELETRIGTEKAGELGKEIIERFTGSLERSLTQFKQTHHLDEPFYHQGKIPELG